MKLLQYYQQYLQEQEKSENTIAKYLNEAAKLLQLLDGREMSKNNLLEYKHCLAYNHLKLNKNEYDIFEKAIVITLF